MMACGVETCDCIQGAVLASTVGAPAGAVGLASVAGVGSCDKGWWWGVKVNCTTQGSWEVGGCGGHQKGGDGGING